MLFTNTLTIKTQSDVDGYVKHVIAEARAEAAARGYVGKDASDYALGWATENLAIVIRRLLLEQGR
jgi:redox-regulated HSP33 family molecular chaperone